jgi:hypothetical protein
MEQSHISKLGYLLCAVSLVAAYGCAKSVSSGNEDASVPKPDGKPTGELALGEPCYASEECASGLCLGVGTQLLCSQECGQCPHEFYCSRVEPDIAPSGEEPALDGYYCLADLGGLCKPCVSSINCTYPADECLELESGESVCGRDCSYDGPAADCPSGYECVSGQCHPIGDTCDCTPERVGVTRRCEISNEHGTCFGQETCAESGWEGCDANTPGPEVCNGEDDNCDGTIPSEELDANDDGTIDCMENCTPEAEVCDLVDNDCDGEVDNGDPVEMCGTVENGTPACQFGECVIASCDEGYADIDSDITTGCECALAASGGATCNQAQDLGSIDDTGQTVSVSGVLGEGGEVWYRVEAVDLTDGVSSFHDNFHFRAMFLTNPSDSYKMDVIAGDCQDPPVCPQSVTDFQWYTNFRQGQGASAIGEGDCMEDPTVDGEGFNRCTNNTTVYFIRVLKVQGSAVTCDSYEIEITNGVYVP